MTTYRNSVSNREELLINGESSKCGMVHRQHEKTTEIVIITEQNDSSSQLSVPPPKGKLPKLKVIILILAIFFIGLIAGMQHSSPEIWTYLQSLLEKLLPLL